MNDAEFEVRIQLCPDLDKMPVEDARKECSEEEECPYLPVADLHIPKQDAYSEARKSYVDDLSFCPSHSLAAHRFRLHYAGAWRAYQVMSELRRKTNGNPLKEPTSIDEVSA